MTSRWLLAVTIPLFVGVLAHAQASMRRVNQERLWTTIQKLSEFGRPAGAGFEGGVTQRRNHHQATSVGNGDLDE
jgi:hypothetical protein